MVTWRIIFAAEVSGSGRPAFLEGKATPFLCFVNHLQMTGPGISWNAQHVEGPARVWLSGHVAAGCSSLRFVFTG